MGGSQSTYVKPDIGAASSVTYTGPYLANLTQQNEAIAKATASNRYAWPILYAVLGAIGIILVILAVLALYDAIIARPLGFHTFILPNYSVQGGSNLQSAGPNTAAYAAGYAAGAAGLGEGGTLPSAPPPPRLWAWLNSGNLLGAQDASQSTTIPASSLGVTSANQSVYTMQWWMYIKDWNYGYGKEKTVLVRPDPTNPKNFNPKVTLHPTDNVLRVSVSVYPADGSAGSDEPVSADAPETASSVFTCDVPNIPLQSWFSVSMTVFERNLDVYINGQLVKSCFMSGIPKPAAGDVKITPNGGFSGLICNYTSSGSLLNPSDAMAFFSADTSCRFKTDTPSVSTTLTGYLVKFGLYDPNGKQIQEYTF
jgi:hypothetical protein